MLLRKEKNLAPVVEKHYPLDSAIGFPINTYPLDSEIVIYPVDIAIQGIFNVSWICTVSGVSCTMTMKQHYKFDIELWKLFVCLLLYDLVLRIAIHVPRVTWLSSIRSFSFLIQVK